jgi:hypothetical protein
MIIWTVVPHALLGLIIDTAYYNVFWINQDCFSIGVIVTNPSSSIASCENGLASRMMKHMLPFLTGSTK